MKKLKLSFLAVLGIAAVTSFASVKDVQAVPAVPQNLQQTISTENGFKVTWTAVTGATDYLVSLSKDNKTFTDPVSTKGVAEYTFVDNENKFLAAGTSYAIRVIAQDATGKSQPASAIIATAPKAMTSFEQTKATSTTVELKWNKSEGATGYIIKMGADAASAKDLATVTSETITLTKLKPDSAYYVAVYPVRKVTDKFYASQNCVYINKVITTADKVTDIEVEEMDVRADYLHISWKNEAKYEAGYQIQLLNSAGKQVKLITVRGRNLDNRVLNTKSLRNKAFGVRLRTYSRMNNERFFGEWSDTTYVIPQCRVTAKKEDATSVTLSWDAIENTKGNKYDIYYTTSDGGTYKKLTSVKGTSYKVTDLKQGNDYYYFVRPQKVKIGGKNRKPTKLTDNNDLQVTLYAGKALAEVR